MKEEIRLNPSTFLPLDWMAGDYLKRYQDIVICNCINNNETYQFMDYSAFYSNV